MKTKLFFTILFVGFLFACEKEIQQPKVNVVVSVYDDNDSINSGARLSSWEDGVWLKGMYSNGDTIFNDYVEIPDTLNVGTWGNKIIVSINHNDTVFEFDPLSLYNEIKLPIIQ